MFVNTLSNLEKERCSLLIPFLGQYNYAETWGLDCVSVGWERDGDLSRNQRSVFEMQAKEGIREAVNS